MRERCIQVGTGCSQVGMSEQFLNVVQGDASFEPTRTRFVAQIVETETRDRGLPTDRGPSSFHGAYPSS